jgi:hypothetical protein
MRRRRSNRPLLGTDRGFIAIDVAGLHKIQRVASQRVLQATPRRSAIECKPDQGRLHSSRIFVDNTETNLTR